MGDKPTMTITEVIEVDTKEAIQIDLDELRRRRIRDGRHLWSIGVIHHIANPEEALDDMDLNASNLIGLTDIICLWCKKTYRPEIREQACE